VNNYYLLSTPSSSKYLHQFNIHQITSPGQSALNTNIRYTSIAYVHSNHPLITSTAVATHDEILLHLSIVSIAPALLLTVEHFLDDQFGQVNCTPHASKPHTIVEIFNCKLPIFSTFNIHNTCMYVRLQLVSRSN
jgi:hypothetical protein